MATLQKKQQHGDMTITVLKGVDRVRKRPTFFFCSDGLEGCENSFFEILFNSVNEARKGYGKEIRVTVYRDQSIEVDDHGRGVPLGWNVKMQNWNWYLIYCELFSQFEGFRGKGACCVQYSSEFMNVYSYNGTVESSIHFKKGEPCSDFSERPLANHEKRIGTVVHWKPDLEVFTDIAIPREFFKKALRQQSAINPGIAFLLRLEQENGKFKEQKYLYENGFADYLTEQVGDASFTAPVVWHLETQGKDRDDRPEYKFKADITFCFSKTVQMIEYYHNSRFLKYGGSPDEAVSNAFTNVFWIYIRHYYLKNHPKEKGIYLNFNYSINNFYCKYKAIKEALWGFIRDHLNLVVSSFSTMTTYENREKKAITNEFIANSLHDFLHCQLECYLFENPQIAEKISKEIFNGMKLKYERGDRVM